MKYVGDSVDLSEYPKLKECLMQNKVFVNINCILDYPQYVAPIMHGDELLGMISLLNTKDSQMNMEFSNKFSIIAELISNSLVRAMALFSYENKYYENTLALNSYYFRDLLRLKSEMKKKQYVKFLLFKVISSKDDLLTTARNAGKIIRFGDAVGLLEDGFLYIYMAQTDYRNIDRIRERLRGYGLELELADENMILQGVV